MPTLLRISPFCLVITSGYHLSIIKDLLVLLLEQHLESKVFPKQVPLGSLPWVGAYFVNVTLLL